MEKNRFQLYQEKAEKLDNIIKEFGYHVMGFDEGFLIGDIKDCQVIRSWIADIIISTGESRRLMAKMIVEQNNILDNIQNEIRKR